MRERIVVGICAAVAALLLGLLIFTVMSGFNNWGVETVTYARGNAVSWKMFIVGCAISIGVTIVTLLAWLLYKANKAPWWR